MFVKALATLALIVLPSLPVAAATYILPFRTVRVIVMKVSVSNAKVGKIEGHNGNFTVSVTLPDWICTGRIRFHFGNQSVSDFGGYNFCMDKGGLIVGGDKNYQGRITY